MLPANHLSPRGSARLQEGWVIANHILVAFHVAFISSVLALPANAILKWEVLSFIFVSPETLVSALFMYLTFHVCVAWHELGHLRTAARLDALNQDALRELKQRAQQSALQRALFFAKQAVLAPYGRAVGVKREGLNYYVDAPFNLAVAAAGPRASRNAALAVLPPALVLLALGLGADQIIAIYAGRLLLGIGLVSLLDFLIADPGKYAAFRERERAAAAKAAKVDELRGWMAQAPELKRRMLAARSENARHPRLGPVLAPWQFRNCGMGGRHTEKEYPESNVSMQEAMFLILSADSYQEAQELTVRLQNRLKEIIEKEEGCRVMGIGLEGGLAPYIEKGDYPLPEVRLWAMMKRAIAECGQRPGVDVAIALDPAMSELELAYRDEHNVPDAVGMYLFWRDKAKTVLDRDAVLELFVQAIERYEIPLLSIEDGFSENDHQGWRALRERLGEQIFIIGDDLVTTNDKTIEVAADQGLINCALIKANQIGTLYETLLAMLVALGKGLELVVSHRSKSPNDDMEAHIALAVNSLGLKAGGGANTERLVKYQSVSELLQALHESSEGPVAVEGQILVRKIRAYEEPTNAGIPTVGCTAELFLPTAGVMMRFRGATPLGTSAGTGEAIHLVDASIEYAEHKEVIDRFPALFRDVEFGVHAFKKAIDDTRVGQEADDRLHELFRRAQRYGGKGCLTAAENVQTIIAPAFEARDIGALGLLEIDRTLLALELRTASRRGKIGDDATADERVHVLQRKQNLGMNAMLSVSLALGRAIARMRGKELYELLREEMLAIVERAAARFAVPVPGNRLVDYISALRQVNERAAAAKRPLHEVLREVSGIYETGMASPVEAERPGDDAREEQQPQTHVARPDEKAARVVSLARPIVQQPSPHPPHAALELLDEVAARCGRAYCADPHHGLRHSYDLLLAASRIASESGLGDDVDWSALTAAVALHDIACEKPMHGVEGARRALEVLGTLPDFPEESKTRATDAIVLHEMRSPDGAARRRGAGLEAQLLYDADQLEAFGAKGIYRFVAIRSQRHSPLAGVASDIRARYENLAFDQTRELAASDYQLSLGFFERLAQHEAAHEASGEARVVDLIREHLDEPPAVLAQSALHELDEEGRSATVETAEARFAVEYFRRLLDAYPPLALEELPHVADVVRASASSKEAGSAREIAETAGLAELDRALYAALWPEPKADLETALRAYLGTKQRLARPSRPFGIANNRLFCAEDGLVVPYLLGAKLRVHLVDESGLVRAAERQIAPGTILTDRSILALIERSGAVIDLETPIYRLDPEQARVVPITRIRDAAALLAKINATTNRNQAVFWLRTLAARLSHLSSKDLLGAKNLQPEIRELTTQLMRYLNGAMPRRLRFLSRLVVRNLSSLVGRPSVIDRLWNDTIELAEVRVPGSAIVNELRRSCHHALGNRTLQIALAYQRFLADGEVAPLAELGFGTPSNADLEARSRPEPAAITGRVVEDLRRLLGSSELVSRIDEWKVSYQESLTRCEFGSSLEGEAETLIAEGLRARNRWSTYHHLRLLDAKVASFSWPAKLGERMRTQLAEIAELRPEDPNLDVETVATALRDGARQFFTDLNAAHRDPLFAALDEAVTAQREERFFDAFVRVRALRQRLVGLLERPAFDEQRYFFFQLEGLLEEMGYLMVRHLISQNQERGVDRSQCLEIIRLTAMNLDFDGLHSRELRDFATMLSDVGRSDAQLLDVLRSVERVYHRVRQRVTQPYERMGARLGIPAADLQQILANIHRYMHDLNSMIHVADLVATSVRQQIAQRPSDAPAVPGPADSGTTSLLDPVIHLSHRSTIAQALEDDSEGRSLREIYGGKGSGLLYISYLNIPTRDGFILPTSYGRSKLYERDVDRLQRELDAHVASLEQDIARRDGHAKRFASADGSPLLLAVRGGSVLSMPGILSTVVFVGMNDAIAERLAEDGPWRAYDSYRRFLASYASSVWGVDIEHHDLVERAKERYGVRYKHELPWEAMREISEATKRVLRDEGLGDELDAVLAEPRRQLAGATRAVFRSWDTPTARRFRDIKGIAHSWHTAAIVQEMAFGNGRNEMIEAGMDETLASLTGVITRTFPMEHGVRALDGEVKFSAAGDDLVSGITFSSSFRPVRDLEQLMPMLETRLKHVVAKLRRLMGTDQEVEFTVERGVLSVLQTRRAETQIDQATDRFLDPGEPATRGLGVRGGGFRGLAIFDEADLNELSRTNLGERDDVDGLLLVIENPTPEDIPLIISAGGLLTARGGSTSHAAVAINGIEKRAYSGVVSAVNLDVDPLRHEAVIRDASGAIRQRIKRGDIVSIHGTTGEVFVGSRRLQRVE